MPRRREQWDDAFRLDSVLDFMRLLWSIEHGLQKKSKRMDMEVGVTGPQRFVLRIVERFPGISAGDLAQVVRLHPSTITGILQRLVDRGLINRRADPSDSRRLHLTVTSAAQQRIKKSVGTVETAVTQALRRVGPQKVKAAREVLSAVADGLSTD